jgi:hypothetical protein
MKPKEKLTMPVGKESVSKVSKAARMKEMEGVDKTQTKILKHSEGCKSKSKKKMKSKKKHHPDDHEGHLDPWHHKRKK